MPMASRFMYAGAKKCLRQTIGWTAVVDGAWKDVDVTFTCAGGNPSRRVAMLLAPLRERCSSGAVVQ